MSKCLIPLSKQDKFIDFWNVAFYLLWVLYVFWEWGVICQAAHASCHAINVEQTSRPTATRTLTCSGVRWLCQLSTGRAAWGCYHPWIGTILGTGPPPHPPLNIKLESTFGPTLIHWTETTAQCLRHTIENVFPRISLLLLLCYFAPLYLLYVISVLKQVHTIAIAMCHWYDSCIATETLLNGFLN